MNTPTPTPRTDAAWSSSFEGKQLSAGQTARALRECSQKLETELAALRAALALGPDNCDEAYEELRADCDELRADVVRLTAERDQLRDQLATARHRETIALASWDEERNRALREGARVVEWRDRAELAEAELATEREKVRTLRRRMP